MENILQPCKASINDLKLRKKRKHGWQYFLNWIRCTPSGLELKYAFIRNWISPSGLGLKKACKGLTTEDEDFLCKLRRRRMSHTKQTNDKTPIAVAKTITRIMPVLSLWCLLFGSTPDGSWLPGPSGESLFPGIWEGGGGGRPTQNKKIVMHQRHSKNCCKSRRGPFYNAGSIWSWPRNPSMRQSRNRVCNNYLGNERKWRGSFQKLSRPVELVHSTSVRQGVVLWYYRTQNPTAQNLQSRLSHPGLVQQHWLLQCGFD